MNIKLTDTHCHLTHSSLMTQLDDYVIKAKKTGVWRFIVPATAQSDWLDVLSLLNRPSENQAIHIALGIHPWYADQANEQHLIELKNLLQQHPHAWVGEIGIDFYDKNQTNAQREQQIHLFETQLILAQKMQRKIIIHNLRGTQTIINSIKNIHFTQGGIVHAFSGSIEEAKMLIGSGFKIGIGSLLLNPHAKKVREAAKTLALNDIVLETDSPFMLKNEVNTPANLYKIATIVSQLRNISLEELAIQTEKNVNALLQSSS